MAIKILKKDKNPESSLSGDSNDNLSFEQVKSLAGALTPQSSLEDIINVLETMAMRPVNHLETEMLLGIAASNTKLGKKILKLELNHLVQELGLQPVDLPLEIARHLLKTRYGNGLHLNRCADGSFWRYAKTLWVETTDEWLRNQLLQVELVPNCWTAWQRS